MRSHLARYKREGWPFELAWDRAFRTIRWPDKRDARDEWKDVIRSGRELWATCYRDEGAPVDVSMVIEAISRDTLDLRAAA